MLDRGDVLTARDGGDGSAQIGSLCTNASDQKKKPGKSKNNICCVNGNLRQKGLTITDFSTFSLSLSLYQVTYCMIDYSTNFSSSMLPILYVIVLTSGS